MGTSSCVLIVLFSACWITNVIHSLPLTTTIECIPGSTVHLGEIDEGYTGDIEVIPSVPDGGLELNLKLCPQCLEFLEFISSVTNATLRTKKPLDMEALREVANNRALIVRDLNDNAPVFEKEEYRANVSETSPVGEVVVQVKAVDDDFSPAHNHITYSIQPPSQTFEASGSGQILLKEPLNYTIASQYNFTVKAQDNAGNFSETRVIINIIDQLRPLFEYNLYEASVPENQYNLYEASVPENQVGPVLEVLPAPIQADTSEESNYTIIYSINEVSPSDYRNNFNVDQVTGVIRVVTELDFEEIKDNITIFLKASLEIDRTRTAIALVTVHVENVNEAPLFHVKLYTAEVFSVATLTFPVVQVKATDPDVGESERLQYSLVEPSSLFAVEPSSGQVYVVSAAGQSGKVTLQVKATDPHGLYATAAVEVTIKDSSSILVVISLNQQTDTVRNKTLGMKEALERALGWSVSIISISSSREGLALNRTTEIHSLQRQDTPKTYVSFIATDTSGTNVIPKETVQNKLLDDKEKVLKEMQQVFGSSLQFDVVDEGGSPNMTTPIILGTVIPLILILIFIGGLFTWKSRHSTSSTDTEPVIDSEQKSTKRGSLEMIADFNKPESGIKPRQAD